MKEYKFKYFRFNCAGSPTLHDIRQEFIRLAFLYHPDITHTNTTREMQEVNAEYDLLLSNANLYSEHPEHEETEIELNEFLREIIHIFAQYDFVNLELIGNWLWITGNTRLIKDLLKENGFYFAPKKAAWYFRTYPYFKKRKENLSFDNMRAKFGSQKIYKNHPQELTQ